MTTQLEKTNPAIPLIEALRDGLEFDGEFGAHWLNNREAQELNKKWPKTLEAISALIGALPNEA